MPYKIVKKNSKWCVYKLDADGMPVGKPLGTHDSQAKAARQMRALYAKMPKEEKAVVLEVVNEDVENVIDTVENKDEMKYSHLESPSNPMPMSMEMPYGGATSFADLEAYRETCDMHDEMETLVDEFQTLQKNVLSSDVIMDKKAGLADLAAEFIDRVSQQIDENVEFDEIDNTDDMDDMGKSIVIEDVDVRDGLTTIKSLGNGRVGAYCVLWGAPHIKDLTNEYFTVETSELTSIFDGVHRLPALYNHSLDSTMKSRVVGVVDTLKKDDVGLWYESQMKMSDEYDRMIMDMIQKGRLKTSTQTFPVARRVESDGRISRWPIVEITFTPTPAEPRMIPIQQLKSAYLEIGENFESAAKALGITYEDDESNIQKHLMLLDIEKIRFEMAIL